MITLYKYFQRWNIRRRRSVSFKGQYWSETNVYKLVTNKF